MKAFALLFTFMLVFSSLASAERREIDSVGIYILGDSGVDNVDGSKKGAREDALRRASEKACVFVESTSTVKDHMLTQDQVNVVSGAVLEVLSERYEMIPLDGCIEFRCFMKVAIDTDSIDEYLKNHKELTATKARNAELEHAVHMISVFESTKGLYTNDPTAEKLYHRACSLEHSDFDKAISLYQDILKLDSNFIDVYARLASCYKDRDRSKALHYANAGIALVKAKKTSMEIDHLVNAWYIRNGETMGDFNPNIQHLYAVKSYLEGVAQKTETTEEYLDGRTIKITKIWTKSDW